MNNRSNVIAAVSYITWIGFVAALVMRDSNDNYVTFHMNQALVLNILEMIGGVLAVFPLIGGIASGIISFAVFVLWIVGVYRAATWSTEPLPFVGDIHIIG